MGDGCGCRAKGAVGAVGVASKWQRTTSKSKSKGEKTLPRFRKQTPLDAPPGCAPRRSHAPNALTRLLSEVRSLSDLRTSEPPPTAT